MVRQARERNAARSRRLRMRERRMREGTRRREATVTATYFEYGQRHRRVYVLPHSSCTSTRGRASGPPHVLISVCETVIGNRESLVAIDEKIGDVARREIDDSADASVQRSQNHTRRNECGKPARSGMRMRAVNTWQPT